MNICFTFKMLFIIQEILYDIIYLLYNILLMINHMKLNDANQMRILEKIFK